MAAIEGRIFGARPGQQIVLYARSGAWYVQPLTDQPFTQIQPDSTWRNSTHLGTEYAALLVEPGYRPPTSTDVLPTIGGGVVAAARVPGEARLLVPLFWQTWWFGIAVGLTCLFALLGFYHLRLRQLTQKLNARFEERLAERTQIAQEIHDTMLQGVLGASMQLHIALDQLSEDSPAKPRLDRVQQLMGQVIEEGRNTIRGMRSSGSDSLDLDRAFERVWQELSIDKIGQEIGEPIDFRIVVMGPPRPLHPILRDEIYRIGREVLVNAFQHALAKSIEVEMEYTAHHLRIFIRDDGYGIDPQVMRSGSDRHSGLCSMRERAEGIGAQLKIRSRAQGGTEVELSVPSRIAFQMHSSTRSLIWLTGSFLQRAGAVIGRLKTKKPNEP